MELVNSLEVNDPEDEYEIFKVQMEKRLESIENRLKALEEQGEIEPAFIIFKVMASKSVARTKDFFENCSSSISLIGLVIAVAIFIVTFFI